MNAHIIYGQRHWLRHTTTASETHTFTHTRNRSRSRRRIRIRISSRVNANIVPRSALGALARHPHFTRKTLTRVYTYILNCMCVRVDLFYLHASHALLRCCAVSQLLLMMMIRRMRTRANCASCCCCSHRSTALGSKVRDDNARSVRAVRELKLWLPRKLLVARCVCAGW